MVTSKESEYGISITYDGKTVGDCKIIEEGEDSVDVSGIKDMGKVILEGDYIQSDGQLAILNGVGGSTVPCVITYSSGETCSFNAFVSRHKLTPHDGRVIFKAILKVSGPKTHH